MLVVKNFGIVRPKYCLKRQNCSLQFFQNVCKIFPKMSRWECLMMVVYFLICFCYRNQEDRPSANMLLQHIYFRLVFVWTPSGFFFIKAFISLVLLKSATYLYYGPQRLAQGYLILRLFDLKLIVVICRNFYGSLTSVVFLQTCRTF